MGDGVVDLESHCDSCGRALLFGDVVRLVGVSNSGAIARHERCWPPQGTARPVPCTRAPAGWECTLAGGHHGGCACRRAETDRMQRRIRHRVDL